MSEDDITSSTNSAPTSLLLRVSEPTIEKGTWPCPDDLLGRNKEIENLSPVLLNAQAPLVFAIDAPWGGGKTTFIKLWQHYLKTQGQVSLYLNCWENDFVDDPLLPMLSVIDSWLSTLDDNSEQNKAWETAKRLTPGIFKTTAVATAKIATFGALDLEKEYEKVIADMAGGAVDGLVDSFNVKKKVLDEFKIQIGKAMEALPNGQQNLIIFIDELDRCRPTYAIEVLERMKHLFDIERVVFVLAINREQLGKSLQGVYGPSFDGSHYLKRFIDLDYQLHVPDQIAYINARFNQKDIIDYFSSRRDGHSELENVTMIIKGLIQRFDYQLRDIDQLIMRFRLILKSIPPTHYLDTAVLCALLILREQNQHLYTRFKDDANCANDVISYLLGSADSDHLPDYFSWVGGWFILSAIDHYQSEIKSSLMKPWLQLVEKLDAESENHEQISRLISIVEEPSGMRNHNIRKLAFDRIELINQITIDVE